MAILKILFLTPKILKNCVYLRPIIFLSALTAIVYIFKFISTIR